MTYQVSKIFSYTMEQTYEEHTDKLISSVHSIAIRTKVVVPTWTTTSLSALPVESKEIAFR